MSKPHAVAQQGRFNDADAWCEAVNDWNLDFRQLDAGRLDAQVQRVIGEDLAIQRVSLSRRFHQQGVAPAGVVTFGIPLGVAPVHWFGRAGASGQFMNFNHRDGFDAVTDTDFAAFTVSLGADDLGRTLQALAGEAGVEPLYAGPPLFGREPKEHATLVTLLTTLMNEMPARPANGKVLEELKAQLRFTLATSILAGSPERKEDSVAGRRRAVERAVELIRHAPDMPTIEALHLHCGVSYRTLNRAFREHFGLTPKQYLLRARLAAAQRALLRARPGARVTDVASDLGFWHLGRFAQAYQRMFFEQPSQTLARGRAR